MFWMRVEGKAVIWAHYQYMMLKQIIERIRKEYGFDSAVVTYYGLTPARERAAKII